MSSSRIGSPAGGGGARVRELRSEREKAARLQLEPPDIGYVAALVGLVSVGIIMVYSTNALQGGLNPLFKIVINLVAGVVALCAGMALPLSFWRRWTLLIMVGSFIALLSLKIPHNPLAISANGATRWLGREGVFSIQPSEFAKLGFILFAANFLEKRAPKMKGEHWLTFLGVLGVYAGLIYKEPDLGTALVLTGTAFFMLIAAGVNGRLLFTGAVLGAALILFLAWNTQHQKARLLAWWNPWDPKLVLEDGHQATRSWAAIARGGLWGVGLGQSTQKVMNRLPESETDFIFAIVAEELGLFRAVGVLLLFGLHAWRGYGIAARAPDRYSGLVVAGITSWVAVQSSLNIGVATGALPNTGVPLPFISSGGSSLMALMLAVGIVIGISRRRKVRTEPEPAAPVSPKAAKPPRQGSRGRHRPGL